MRYESNLYGGYGTRTVALFGVHCLVGRDELKAMLTRAGNVEKLFLVMDRRVNPTHPTFKGYGFATYATRRQAEYAVWLLDGCWFYDKQFAVKMSETIPHWERDCRRQDARRSSSRSASSRPPSRDRCPRPRRRRRHNARSINRCNKIYVGGIDCKATERQILGKKFNFVFGDDTILISHFLALFSLLQPPAKRN